MPKLVENFYLQDLEDRINVLFAQEEKYACNNYLYDENTLNSQGVVVDEDCRKMMSLWMCKIVKYCDYSSELACVAMYFLDRFLSTPKGKFVLYNKQYYQLASVCCLQLAIKMHEKLKFDMTTLSKLCHGFFNSNDFNCMEYTILSALKWELCPPTSYIFLELFLELLPPNANVCQETLRELVNKQIVATMQEYKFVTINPSLIAVSSLFNALDHVKLPYGSQVSFVHNIYATTGIDCTDTFIADLRQHIMNSTNSNHQPSKSSPANTPRMNCNRDAATERTHSPVCVSEYK